MSLMDGTLHMSRKFAAGMFRDACTIRRVTGKEWNEAAGVYAQTYTQIYPDPATGQTAGPCRLLAPYRAPTTADTPGQVENIKLARLSLPVDTSLGIQGGDEVLYVSSASDPDLPGKSFVVAVGSQASDTSARRIPIQEFS